jgi:hypothetical protein
MRLYHFTGLRALVGDAGLAVIRPGVIDLATVAAPDSIIAAGLKPFRSADYDRFLSSPLPPCVWLTNDPDMAPIFSSFKGFRVTVLIPSIDRRLVHWPKYFLRHAGRTWRETIQASDLPDAEQRTTESFYVYFGEITRIAAVERKRAGPDCK